VSEASRRLEGRQRKRDEIFKQGIRTRKESRFTCKCIDLQENDAADSDARSSEQEATSITKMAVTNPIQMENFKPSRQPLVRWLQSLEGAFRVFQVQKDTDKVAYLLHFVSVDAFCATV